jgi:hypothetical protein
MAGKLDSDVSHVETELDRIGLLMQHDKALPSATTIIAGAPIAGSWWGHPKGKRIYEVLEELADGPLALCVKLVNGKRTYVHHRLWSPFLLLVKDHEQKAARDLLPLARALYDRATREGRVSVEALAEEGMAPARELLAAAGEIEERLLLHVRSIHAESGAHWKVLETWDDWAQVKEPGMRRMPVTTAATLLRTAVTELARGARRPPKVALF